MTVRLVDWAAGDGLKAARGEEGRLDVIAGVGMTGLVQPPLPVEAYPA